ncbi:MAG TPA: phytoene/squalene synthase family protein [Terriglobales bacterium]|nr:phytoene/squalene synthase family protein [Terriglobales bacterium]
MSAAQQGIEKAAPAALQPATAYAVCRQITRSSAKNFYYAFLVLPRAKRDALSAVYAFMRRADDISDDPALDRDDKADRLDALTEAMHAVMGGKPTDDAVLMALADAQRRFHIPVELLDKLVAGTAMDIFGIPGVADDPRTGIFSVDFGEHPGVPNVISAAHGPAPRVLCRTFSELYTYCYHVASVVGLVCIRIFGYRDPAANGFAERTGIAFQLTNIIRDVREDAAMGRIYLPAEDLAEFGLTAADFTNPDPVRLRPLLEFEAKRAREYYAAAPSLVPLVDKDSRPALWVLVEIYRRLLEKIAARKFDIGGEKIRLSTWEKLLVVARGAWRRLL